MTESLLCSPWQAPPAFLVAHLTAHIRNSELRWGLHFAQYRLISRGWREAADDALPALTPRQYLPADEVPPLARRLGGLKLLRLDTLSESTPQQAWLAAKFECLAELMPPQPVKSGSSLT